MRWYSSGNSSVGNYFHAFIIALLNGPSNLLNPLKTSFEPGSDTERTNLGKLLHELSPHINLQHREVRSHRTSCIVCTTTYVCQVVLEIMSKNPELFSLCLACFSFHWGTQASFSAVCALTYLSHLLLHAPLPTSATDIVRRAAEAQAGEVHQSVTTLVASFFARGAALHLHVHISTHKRTHRTE
jgi:hypothetical protein